MMLRGEIFGEYLLGCQVRVQERYIYSGDLCR